jgi:hypothetical protein
VREFVGATRDNEQVTSPDPLFSKHDLRSTLDHQVEQLRKAVDAWDPDQLLAAAEADVVDELVDRHTAACPVLRRDERHLVPTPELVGEAQAWGGGTRQVRMTQIVLAVPFDGDKAVFTMRASRFRNNQPRAIVLDDEIRVGWIGDRLSQNPEALREHFDQELDKIEEHLSWCRSDIERHNAQIRQAAPGLVAQRRAKLLADRQLEAGLGFPIRQRPDAGLYAVPLTRRKIATRTPTTRSSVSGPFQPEPVLSEPDYEAALAVLRNSRNALERSPSLTAGFGEQQIRDILLVNLNAVFEGQAAGEVFNGFGKTDILIRVRDRNIFIGECKIWHGPSTIADALDQLLGYLVWRDTKAALLFFIRNKDVTAVIGKATAEIERHANYKRRGTHDSDERVDFVLHASGDPAREIRLALLPFALRPATV